MKNRGLGPDVVAMILASALFLSVVVIGIALILSVVDQRTPIQTLGENTTQVLTGLIGGIIGVLGSYLGQRFRKHKQEGEEDE